MPRGWRNRDVSPRRAVRAGRGLRAHAGPRRRRRGGRAHGQDGLVASVDVFYNTDPDYAQRWRDRGVLAFEMEASALFYLAARDGVQAACALTVSDVLGDDVTTEESYLPLDELNRAIDSMIEVALEAGTAT